MMTPYAEIFKELRTKRGMSQKDEADALAQLGLDVNNAHVSRWENGSNKPSLEHFIALCHLFGIRNVYDVFGEGSLMGLTKDLNEEGVQRLLEYQEMLLRNPKNVIDHTPLPSSDGKRKSAAHPFLGPASMLPGWQPEITENGLRSIPLYRLWDENALQADEYRMVEAGPHVPETVRFAVLVHGNAMTPHLRHGSMAWIEPVDTPDPTDIVLVQLNSSLYLRVYQMTDYGILLIPSNPSFKPFLVSGMDSLQVVGRVATLPVTALPSLLPEDVAKQLAEEAEQQDSQESPESEASQEAKQPQEAEQSQEAAQEEPQATAEV